MYIFTQYYTRNLIKNLKFHICIVEGVPVVICIYLVDLKLKIDSELKSSYLYSKRNLCYYMYVFNRLFINKCVGFWSRSELIITFNFLYFQLFSSINSYNNMSWVDIHPPYSLHLIFDNNFCRQYQGRQNNLI